MPLGSTALDAFSQLGLDELGVLLGNVGSNLNGWFTASSLAACSRTLRDHVALWRGTVTELSFAGAAGLDDDVLASLTCTCPHLRAVNISKNGQITDDGVCALLEASTAGLSHLELSTCQHLTDRTLLAIARTCARSLLWLDVSSCRYITEAGAVQLCQSCTRLSTLKLSFCALALTDGTLEAMGEHLPLLETVGLRVGNSADAERMSSGGVVALARGLPRLQTLDLGLCRRPLDDDALIAIGENCPQLTRLDVTSCTRLTDAGVAALASSCRQLRRLEATQLAVTGRAIERLAACCASLDALNLDHCKNVDKAAWTALSAESVHLRWLSAVCCSLDDEDVKALAAGCSLRVLRLGPERFHPAISIAAMEQLAAAHPNLAIMGGPSGAGGQRFKQAHRRNRKRPSPWL